MATSNKVAIMQPTYLPWLGYFSLMKNVDTFVILDDVQFEKRSWQQRNRIISDGLEIMLTVPVLKTSSNLIKNIKIDKASTYYKKHLKTILQSYSKSRYLSEHMDFFSKIYCNQFDKLIDLNMQFISYVKSFLKIETNIIFSSHLSVEGQKEHKLLNICKKIYATKYISPIGSVGYLRDGAYFSDAGIEFEYFNYQHPNYKQLTDEFIPKMSIIDILLNENQEMINSVI